LTRKGSGLRVSLWPMCFDAVPWCLATRELRHPFLHLQLLVSDYVQAAPAQAYCIYLLTSGRARNAPLPMAVKSSQCLPSCPATSKGAVGVSSRILLALTTTIKDYRHHLKIGKSSTISVQRLLARCCRTLRNPIQREQLRARGYGGSRTNEEGQAIYGVKNGSDIHLVALEDFFEVTNASRVFVVLQILKGKALEETVV
jgi:hypothetical protein